MNNLDIFTIEKNRGEFDFSINCCIEKFSRYEMDEFRRMCMVAIGRAENMWSTSRNGMEYNENNKNRPN